jgi:hypothetical protein
MCSATNTRLLSTRAWIASTSSSSGTNAAPGEKPTQLVADLCLPRRADGAILDHVEHACRPVRIDAPLRARAQCRVRVLELGQRIAAASRGAPQATTSGARPRSAPRARAEAGRRAARRAAPVDVAVAGLAERGSPRGSDRSRRASASLFANESSTLMRSMASVYSPSRSSGITTSSLTLNAFVCRAIARSCGAIAPERLARSAPIAMKPSPERAFASRTTSDVHGRRALVVADDVADQHIFGNAPRFDLVEYRRP